ncbi:MAG: hypothetical protein ABW157_13410 [Candidatus Thiodiazotropha sp. LLP2]
MSKTVVRVAQNTEEKADLDRERIHLKSEIETLQVEYGAFDFGVDEAHQTQHKIYQLREQLVEVELKHD